MYSPVWYATVIGDMGYNIPWIKCTEFYGSVNYVIMKCALTCFYFVSFCVAAYFV